MHLLRGPLSETHDVEAPHGPVVVMRRHVGPLEVRLHRQHIFLPVRVQFDRLTRHSRNTTSSNNTRARVVYSARPHFSQLLRLVTAARSRSPHPLHTDHVVLIDVHACHHCRRPMAVRAGVTSQEAGPGIPPPLARCVLLVEAYTAM